MQNRRDQVQAHTFVVGRLVSALLRAEPDAPMTPLRRFIVGVIGGVVLGALVVAGFGIYGVFSPGGNTSWQSGGVLVVEKESGARYVVVDGVLRPVINYTSARLILGEEPSVVRVSRNSLKAVPHGLAVGIVGAPDYLPDPSDLDARDWQVCSTQRADLTGAKRPFVTVQIGQTGRHRSAGPDEGMLVRTPAGQLYLAWHNQRFRLSSPAVLAALGYSAAPQLPAGWSWINALPAGPDLAAEDVLARGTAGPTINGRTSVVGHMFRVVSDTGAPSQHFVMLDDGLSPLTPLGAALMLADPGTRSAYPDGFVAVADLSPASLAQAPKSAISSANPDLPGQPPSLMPLNAGEAPCLRLTMTQSGPQVVIGAGDAAPAAESAPFGADPAQGDWVEVSGGKGLLIRELPAPGIADGTLYLLVDNGVRYPIPDVATADLLGYDGVTPAPVPALLLALVPSGRPLDRDAAHSTVPPINDGSDAAG